MPSKIYSFIQLRCYNTSNLSQNYQFEGKLVPLRVAPSAVITKHKKSQNLSILQKNALNNDYSTTALYTQREVR